MEILIGLAVATVLLIGICRGNLFATVFASLPVGLLTAGYAISPGKELWAMACGALLVAIWIPRLRAKARAAPTDLAVSDTSFASHAPSVAVRPVLRIGF